MIRNAINDIFDLPKQNNNAVTYTYKERKSKIKALRQVLLIQIYLENQL